MQNYSSTWAQSADTTPQITFTATLGASGKLLLGSSRETGSWDPAINPGVLKAILARAITFLPDLAAVDLAGNQTRVGFRPSSTSGRPVIGPVPDCPGVFVAAGHEGSGLTLAPATGIVVKEWILEGQPSKEWALPFMP